MDNAPQTDYEQPQLFETPEQPQGEQKPAKTGVTPVSEFVPRDQPLGAAPEKNEIERLLEDPSIPLALASGTPFRIRQLKMREMLRLLRIISRGSAAMLGEISFDSDNPDEFVQTFIALVVFAIPEAEDETIDFVQSMVDPVPTGNAQADAEARINLMDELSNPELDDLITILSAIIASEGRDLAALGKRLRALLGTARKMGQVPDSLKPVAGG